MKKIVLEPLSAAIWTTTLYLMGSHFSPKQKRPKLALLSI